METSRTKKIYFVDVVYYQTFRFYRRFEKDLNEFSGQALTSVCLSLNILMLLFFIEQTVFVNMFENKWNSLFITLPVLVLVVVRYTKFITIDDIEDALYEKAHRSRLTSIADLYILLSLLGSLIIAIYFGEINNPPPFWQKWF